MPTGSSRSTLMTSTMPITRSAPLSRARMGGAPGSAAPSPRGPSLSRSRPPSSPPTAATPPSKAPIRMTTARGASSRFQWRASSNSRTARSSRKSTTTTAARFDKNWQTWHFSLCVIYNWTGRKLLSASVRRRLSASGTAGRFRSASAPVSLHIYSKDKR